MGIENLKRWHWIVIGVLLGALVGYMRVSYTDDLLDWQLPATPLEQRNFEGLILTRFNVPKGSPLGISKITVYPYKDPNLKNKTDKNKYSYLISCVVPDEPNLFERGVNKNYKLNKVRYYAANPYVPIDGTKLEPNATVLDYLKKIDERDKAKGGLSYTLAWWTLPHWTMVLWTGGSALVIGGIWPFILNLLIGAGFGRPAKTKEEFDLSRFKGGPEEKKEEAKAQVTQEDLDKLTALERELEAKLAADASEHPAGGQPVTTAASGPVRKLAGAPADAPKVEEKPKDEKDFGITQEDFYPTEVHGHAKKKP